MELYSLPASLQLACVWLKDGVVLAALESLQHICLGILFLLKIRWLQCRTMLLKWNGST